MRKKIVALVALLAMCLTLFLGCNLISKNEERDLNQVVATVGDVQIRKKELRDSFLSSGYQYIQNGMSQEEAIDTTLDLMVKREVIVQKAISEMTSDNSSNVVKTLDLTVNKDDSSSVKQDKKRISEVIKCISQKQIEEVEWQIWQSKYSMLQEYEKDYLTKATAEEKKTMNKEIYAEDRAVRTNPNEDSAVAVGIIPEYAKKNEEGNYIDSVQGSAYDALARKIKTTYQLTLEEFDYNVLRTYLESELIDDYSKKITGKSLLEYVDENGNATQKLLNEVVEVANDSVSSQKEAYIAGTTKYEDLLSADAGNLPIAIGQAGYAQVKQILIKFDDKTASRLKSLQTDDSQDKDAYKQARESLALELILSDKRQNKLLNTNYSADYLATDKIDIEGKPSSNGTWRSDDWYNSVNYKQGYNDRYIAGNKEAFPLWLAYDTKKTDIDTLENLKSIIIAELGSVVSAKQNNYSNYINKAMTVEEDAFVDLIYKYNEDPGMMKEDANYVITPGTVPGESPKWVEEFDTAAREAVAAVRSKGVSATASDRISITVSDNGIHIIYVTAVYDDTSVVVNEVKADEINTKNTSAYHIRETLMSSKESNIFTDFANKYYDEVKKEGGLVTIDRKAYKSFYKETFFE